MDGDPQPEQGANLPDPAAATSLAAARRLAAWRHHRKRPPPTPTRAPAAPRTYRVEHRTREGTAVLGQLSGAFPHHATLTPFVARLQAERAGGQLVLVDEATGAVVARRNLARRVRRHWAPAAGRGRRPAPAGVPRAATWSVDPQRLGRAGAD